MLIHLGIASDQVLANLIPVLIEKPDKIYLVATDEIENRELPVRLKDIIQSKVRARTRAVSSVRPGFSQHASRPGS